jgi:hypothetical protein
MMRLNVSPNNTTFPSVARPGWDSGFTWPSVHIAAGMRVKSAFFDPSSASIPITSPGRNSRIARAPKSSANYRDILEIAHEPKLRGRHDELKPGCLILV